MRVRTGRQLLLHLSPTHIHGETRVDKQHAEAQPHFRSFLINVCRVSWQ